jgi:cytoskeletal protein CcmA (bactofilin family)
MGLFLAGSAAPALAADRAAADFVVVGVDEVIKEDLYAVGNSVDVRGTIDGDLIAFSGSEVRIGGTVTGDVIAVTGRVIVEGTVEGSVRATAAEVSIDGLVRRDVVVVAGRTEVTGRVERDLMVWGWSLNLAGTVDGFVWGQTIGTTRISGDVGHDVEMTVGRLEVLAGTSIVGDLGYRADSAATVDDTAEVGGQLVQRQPTRQNIRLRAVVLVGAILGVLLFIAGGLSLFWFSPRTMRLAIETVRTEWKGAALTGLLLLPIPLLAPAVIVAIVGTAEPDVAFPLALALVPVAVGVAGVFALALLAAPVPVLTAVGNLAVPRHSAFLGFLVGAGVLILAMLIPYVRWFVLFSVLVLGLGSWVMGAVRARGDTGWEAEPLLTQNDS